MDSHFQEISETFSACEYFDSQFIPFGFLALKKRIGHVGLGFSLLLFLLGLFFLCSSNLQLAQFLLLVCNCNCPKNIVPDFRWSQSPKQSFLYFFFSPSMIEIQSQPLIDSITFNSSPSLSVMLKVLLICEVCSLHCWILSFFFNILWISIFLFLFYPLSHFVLK